MACTPVCLPVGALAETSSPSSQKALSCLFLETGVTHPAHLRGRRGTYYGSIPPDSPSLSRAASPDAQTKILAEMLALKLRLKIQGAGPTDKDATVRRLSFSAQGSDPIGASRDVHKGEKRRTVGVRSSVRSPPDARPAGSTRRQPTPLADGDGAAPGTG